MTSFVLFVCGCLLCAIFLATLYGDSLPLLELLEGRWLTSLLQIVGGGLASFARVFELFLQFLLNNLMWVIATSAGACGLTLVLALITGGLALDAAEYQRDISLPVASGGVLDSVTDLQEQRKQNPVPAMLASVSRRDRDESLMLWSSWSSDYRLFDPAWDVVEGVDRERRRPPLWPLPGDFTDFPASRPASRRPVLDVRFRRLDSRDDEGQYSVFGELVETFPDVDFVERAVDQIVRGAWRQAQSGGRFGDDRESESFREELAESSATDVRRLEQSVRVIPGAGISEQQLQVEKLVPEEVEGDVVELRIRLTNAGRQTINGLLVRETLPAGTRVRQAFPEPVFRDATLTWLIDGFRPGEERILEFTAVPALDTTFPRGVFRDLLFESDTEVSAVLAVAAPVEVLEAGGSSEVREPPLSPAAGFADVRMLLDEPDQLGTVGVETRYFFNVTNDGTAPSNALRLRVTLDATLKHKQLQDGVEPRQVFVAVRPLQPGEARRYELVVRPLVAGPAVSTAELLDGDSQLAMEVLRLNSASADGGGAP